MITIKKVETKYVTERPFAGLVEVDENEGEFVPYYTCKIVTDNGNYNGKGETKETAHQDAVENFRSAMVREADKAISEYNAEQGVYFVDC